MFTLFMILMVAWVLTRWMGAGNCSVHDRSLRRARRERWRLEEETATDRGKVLNDPAMRAPGARPVVMETPLEKLQREFATGAITVEQYEHEVGKLYGVRGEA